LRQARSVASWSCARRCELLLQEELEQRNAAAQRVLQHEHVDPALVVAVHQVPAAGVQPFGALHVPLRGLDEPHPAAVAGHPAVGEDVQDRVDAPAHRLEGQQQLDQRAHEDEGAPEERVQGEQQRCQHAAQQGRHEASSRDRL